MKVAIMQPYFFPYIGYFQLINAVDEFVLFDDAQYIKRGWVNRNRILKPGDGWQYISVPVQKHPLTEKIKHVELHKTIAWKEKILGQLQHYKKKAPFFDEILEDLNKIFRIETGTIADLNAVSLKYLCKKLNIETKIITSSSITFDYSSVSDAGEWALEMSKQMKAATYINPAGGAELFDKNKFTSANIELKFFQPVLPHYEQLQTFEKGLSILDTLMFLGTNATREQIIKGKVD